MQACEFCILKYKKYVLKVFACNWTAISTEGKPKCQCRIDHLQSAFVCGVADVADGDEEDFAKPRQRDCNLAEDSAACQRSRSTNLGRSARDQRRIWYLITGHCNYICRRSLYDFVLLSNPTIDRTPLGKRRIASSTRRNDTADHPKPIRLQLTLRHVTRYHWLCKLDT